MRVLRQQILPCPAFIPDPSLFMRLSSLFSLIFIKKTLCRRRNGLGARAAWPPEKAWPSIMVSAVEMCMLAPDFPPSPPPPQDANSRDRDAIRVVVAIIPLLIRLLIHLFLWPGMHLRYFVRRYFKASDDCPFYCSPPPRAVAPCRRPRRHTRTRP